MKFKIENGIDICLIGMGNIDNYMRFNSKNSFDQRLVVERNDILLFQQRYYLF
jgi:hypothetical protein